MKNKMTKPELPWSEIYFRPRPETDEYINWSYYSPGHLHDWMLPIDIKDKIIKERINGYFIPEDQARELWEMKTKILPDHETMVTNLAMELDNCREYSTNIKQENERLRKALEKYARMDYTWGNIGVSFDVDNQEVELNKIAQEALEGKK